jgi:hypothetical protein
VAVAIGLSQVSGANATSIPVVVFPPLTALIEVVWPTQFAAALMLTHDIIGCKEQAPIVKADR